MGLKGHGAAAAASACSFALVCASWVRTAAQRAERRRLSHLLACPCPLTPLHLSFSLQRWYNIAARTHIETAMRLYGSAPTVVVLYPPVEVRPPQCGGRRGGQGQAAATCAYADLHDGCPARSSPPAPPLCPPPPPLPQPFPAKSQLHGGEGGEGEAAEAARHHIMVLGRFFSGRQSKVGGGSPSGSPLVCGAVSMGAAGQRLQALPPFSCSCCVHPLGPFLHRATALRSTSLRASCRRCRRARSSTWWATSCRGTLPTWRACARCAAVQGAGRGDGGWGEAGAAQVTTRNLARTPPAFVRAPRVCGTFSAAPCVALPCMQRAKHLPVNFHIGVSPQVIEEVMHTSLVQWHLTGGRALRGRSRAGLR